MSSNEKNTDAIPLGVENSVNQEFSQNSVNEQEQAPTQAETAGQSAPQKPAKPVEKKSGFFRFGRRAAKSALAHEEAPVQKEPAPAAQPAPSKTPKAAKAPIAANEAPRAAEAQQDPAEAPKAPSEQPAPKATEEQKVPEEPIASHEAPEAAEKPQATCEAPKAAPEQPAPAEAPNAEKTRHVREEAQVVEEPEIPAHEIRHEERHEEPREKPAPGGNVASTARPGLCGQIFNALAHIGPLALVCILACMVWPDYWLAFKGQALYCPPEATSITTFLNSVAQGNMLEPHGLVNGSFVAQWPVFTWFVALLALIPAGADLLWPIAGSVGAALALVAVWCLAHASRFGIRAAFAAGLILLCAPLFAPLGHFVGKSALTAALIIFALVFFTRGWLSDNSWISLPLAFLFTGLAGLSGGLYAFLLPLLATLFFLIWRANLGRASRADAILGFGLLLALIGVWLGLVILRGTDESYLNALFANAWHTPWPLPANWWLAGLIAVVGLFPWILLVICVSWARVLKTSLKTLSASRHDNGSAMVWTSLVLAWILTFVFPGATHIAAITTACLLAILLGKAFVNLPDFGNRFYFLLNAICLVIAGIFILGLGFDFSQSFILGLLPITLPADLPPLLLSTDGVWLTGAICLLGGLIMFKYFRRNRQGGGLIFCTVLSMALAQPTVLMIAPELGARSFSHLKNLQAIEQSWTNALKPAATPAQTEPQSPNAPAAPAESQAAPAEKAPEAAPAIPAQPAVEPDAPEAAEQSATTEPAEKPVTPATAAPAKSENAVGQQAAQATENDATDEAGAQAPATEAPAVTPEAKPVSPRTENEAIPAARPEATDTRPEQEAAPATAQ